MGFNRCILRRENLHCLIGSHNYDDGLPKKQPVNHQPWNTVWWFIRKGNCPLHLADHTSMNQLLSTVKYPTFTNALIRSPYLMVKTISLRITTIIAIKILETKSLKPYPKPIHARIAAMKLVAKTPYVSIIGRRPATAPDKIMARNPLGDKTKFRSVFGITRKKTGGK